MILRVRILPIVVLVSVVLASLSTGGTVPAAAQQPCGTAPPPRLTTGQTARVTIDDGVGNNLRTIPSAGALVLGVLKEGEVVTVLAGPQCADNYYWWQVRRTDGQTGWTAEGSAGDYWMEPWPPTAAPPGITPVGAAGSIGQNAVAAIETNTGGGDAAVPIVLVPGAGAPLQVGTQAAPNARPAWSPDGTRLAVSDGNDILVLRADGTQATNLTNSPAAIDTHPTWSPDGQRIAFASESNGNSEIVTMTLTGGPPITLSMNAGADQWPAWSPDGTRIAFASDAGGMLDAYITSAAGGMTPQRLTTGLILAGPPRWSPDAQRIAFATTTPTGQSSIVIANANGSGSAVVATGPGRRHDPAWSPDAQRIAFAAETVPGAGREALLSVRADGTDLLQLTSEYNGIDGLSWSPDGNWIVFAANANGTFDLFVVRPDGTNLSTIAANPQAHVTAPAFQPVFAPGLALPTASMPTPTAPAINPATTDLLLTYDPAVPVFTLQNVSGRSVNLLGLTFSGAGRTVPASIWAQYSFTPLDNFKVNGCLMIWGYGLPEQPAPPECGDARQAWLTNDGYIFWTAGSFTVSYNGAVVATCDSAAGRCAIDLP